MQQQQQQQLQQTRKSSNLGTVTLTNSVWQSTTLGAISRQAKGLANQNSASRGSKSDAKRPFISSSNSKAALAEKLENQLTGSGKKGKLKPLFNDSVRSPNAPQIKVSTAGFLNTENPAGTLIGEYATVKNTAETRNSVNRTSKTTKKDIIQSRTAGSINGHQGLAARLKGENEKQPQQDWEQEYDQQNKQVIKIEDYGFGASKKSIPMTQSQTHTGNGAQQNLFIKNLFFIQSAGSSAGGANMPTSRNIGDGIQPFDGGSLTSRNEPTIRLGFTNQSCESAPVTQTNRGQQQAFNSTSSRRSKDNTFTSSRFSHPNSATYGDRFSHKAQSVKPGGGNVSDFNNFRSNCGSTERKTAIDIAAKVLQQLAPLSQSSNNEGLRILQTDQDSIESLRVIVPQQKVPCDNEKNINHYKSPKQSVTHAKSASPEKRLLKNRRMEGPTQRGKDDQKSLEMEDPEFTDIALKEPTDINETHAIIDAISPIEANTHQDSSKRTYTSQTQEISLFGNNQFRNSQPRGTKQASYGELPVLGKSNLRHSQVEDRQSKIKATSSQQKTKGTTNSSRNTSEVFNYKMKTLNVTAMRQQALKPAQTQIVTNYLSAQTMAIIDVDTKSDKKSFHSNQVKANSPNKQSIIKSQSQQQIKSALRKQPSESQAFNNDAMHLSIANMSQRQQPRSQAQESENGENSQLKYDSALCERQSDLSSNISRVDRQSIKVMARFRPLNEIEKEVQELYPNKQPDVIEFTEDLKSIKVLEEFHTHNNNLIFTFDHIFMPTSTQNEVFDMIGKSMIDDIMCGYNGTIFAYGQTGSGKTFTMYGIDLFDEQMMGIVPRAARQIFDHIREQDLEVEYSIRVQMVEIYKETLRDLLHNTNERAPELKIKEDPKRGTYVEGLTDICIVSEEEIMTAISIGETMRHVASTQLNQVSSRSHAILMIDVVQKFPNDSERRGVLNLVDLAGSERVSRSMAQGSALEEAKKINFSLSMLGKVINSLVKNSPHIPYRDSKLTRLLKESLGGNNKTSLIVACSTHYTNFEETLSTLRFAQSAKHIQNKVKLNIKSSNEELQIIIEQLKTELKCAKEEIFRLRIQTSAQQNYPQSDSSILSNAKSDDEHDNHQTSQTNQQLPGSNMSIIGSTPLQAIHNRPHQSLAAKNYDVIETNNNQRTQLLSILANDTVPTISPSKVQAYTLNQKHTSCSEHAALIKTLVAKNEELEMKLRSKEVDLEAMIFEKDELSVKLQALEEKNTRKMEKLLIIEKKVAEFENEKDQMSAKNADNWNKLKAYESQIEILNQQVKCLEISLKESEQQQTKLLQEKQEIYKMKLGEFFDHQIQILKIPATKGLESLISRAKQAQELFSCDSFIHQLNIEQDFTFEKEGFQSSLVNVPLNEKDLLMQNLYSMEMLNGVETGSIPPEITIYLLKNQLIDACLANHSLQRLLASNRWRQVIEFGKYKIKAQQSEQQESTISALEQIVERSRRTHEKLKARVDKLEGLINQQRQQQNEGDIALWTDAASNLGSNADIMTHRVGGHGFDQLNRSSNMPNAILHQSLVSGSLMNSCTHMNGKSRFKKPITSKAIRKMFIGRQDNKSPDSRASLGRSLQNSSLMTHYFNLKKNQMTYLPKGPLSQVDSNTQGGSGSDSSHAHTGVAGAINQVIDPVGHGNFEAAAADAVDLERDDLDNDYTPIDPTPLVQDVFNNGANHTRAMSLFNRITLTIQEIRKIESSKNLQEVKDFLQSKIKGLSQIDHKMFDYRSSSQAELRTEPFSKRKAPKSQSPEQTRKNDAKLGGFDAAKIQRISETNEVLREDNTIKAIREKPEPVLRLPLEKEANAIQEVNLPRSNEPIMTMGSEMLNSSINMGMTGCHGGFFGMTVRNHFATGGGGNHFFQPHEIIDRLQDKIIHLQEEVDNQKNRSDELKKVCQETKKQNQALHKLMEEKEVRYNQVLKDEIYQWELAINHLKALNESELQRKQKEIEKLHELLAKWIDSFQQLAHSKGTKQHKDLEILVEETMKHNKKRKNPVNEVMLSNTPQAFKDGVHHALQGPSSFFNQNMTKQHDLNSSKPNQQLGGQTIVTGTPATKIQLGMAQSSNMHSIRSPMTGNFYNLHQFHQSLHQQSHQQATPQSKLQYKALQTEYYNYTQKRTINQGQLIQSVAYNAPLATQGSCASPTINFLLSDQRERTEATHRVILGDTSPPLHQQSSLDDEDSNHSGGSPLGRRLCQDNDQQQVMTTVPVCYEEDGIRIRSREAPQSSLSNESHTLKQSQQQTQLPQKLQIDIRDRNEMTDETESNKEELKKEERLVVTDYDSCESSQIVLNLQSPSHQMIDSEFMASRISQCIGSLVEKPILMNHLHRKSQ